MPPKFMTQKQAQKMGDECIRFAQQVDRGIMEFCADMGEGRSEFLRRFRQPVLEGAVAYYFNNQPNLWPKPEEEPESPEGDPESPPEG